MAGGSQPQVSDSRNYVEYEEYVDFQLEKTRAVVKRTDILTTLMALAVGVIGYLLAFVIFDQWIIDGGFGYASRVGLLVLVAVVVMGTLTWRVALPLLRQVHPLYAAKVIEQSDPNLKSNLVNFVDVKLANAESAPVVLKAMQKRAAVQLSHIDVEEAVDHRPLLRIAYALLGVVIVAALYIFLSPKDVFVSVRRALLSSSAVATRTTITDVDPGNKDVPARTRQLIAAEVHGEEADQAQILFTTADHKYVDEPVKMRRESPGLSRFLGELNGENGKGLLQSLTYRIVAGDARTIDYAINVIQPPSARVDDVKYVFPKYTELEEKTTPGGDIDGWEGSIVTVKATSNMKVAFAYVVMTDTDDKGEKGEEISMQVTDGTALSATWRLEFRPDGTSPRYYHIRVRTDNQKKDEIDSDPTQYAYRIRADQRPDVALLDPTGDLTRPANAVIPLLVQASDPDFKVRSVILRGTRGGESLFTQDIKLFEDQLEARSVAGKYNLRLELLRLEPGQTVQFWIEAKDNKHPTANRTNTTPFNVTIEKPVSAEEVQKQLAKDEQKQQDQLAQANNADNPEASAKERTEKRDGDKGSDSPQPRRDPRESGATPPEEKAEPDAKDDADRNDAGNSSDQKRKPASNDEALSRLLKKQPPQNQDQQNPDEQHEEQGASDEKQADRSHQERGEGAGKTGQNDSKNQDPSKSDQSSGREPGDQSSSTGERQGRQTKPDDKNSDSEKGDGSANQPDGNKKQNQQQRNARDKNSQRDKDAAGNESNDQNRDRSAKSAEKNQNKEGSRDDAGSDGQGMKKTANEKKKAAGDQGEPPKSDDANAGKTEKGRKKDDAAHPGKNDGASEDPAKDEAHGDDNSKKDKSAKSPNEPEKSGDDGDGKTPDGNSEKKKPDANQGGSGDDDHAGDGGQDQKKKNQERGGSGKKAADKSEPGGGKDDQRQGEGTPGQADKNEGDQQEGDAGGPGDKTSKKGKNPKKGNGDSDPNGPETPAEDDGTAKEKSATGKEQGEATGDEGQGDRENPRAGEKVKKKEGSNPGSKKPSTGDANGEKKTGQKRPDDEGSEGGTDDAEHADRAPDDKKAREKPGRLENPPSEKGVKPRDEGSEKRPGQNPDVGNQPLKGTGRKDGQKSEQPDAGEQGGGAASNEGKKGANKAGPGDKSNEPGNTDEANQETGQPGSGKKGKGSSTRPSDNREGDKQDAAGENPGDQGSSEKPQGKKGGKQGKGNEGQEGDESAEGKPSGESGSPKGGKQSGGQSGKDAGGKPGGKDASGNSSKPGQPGSGQQRSGGGISSDPGKGKQDGNRDNGGGEPPEPGDRGGRAEPPTAEEEAANVEAAKKATNLVLKRLKSQLERGEVDQEMLDEMGWKDRKDVEKFVKYLEDNLRQNADDDSPEAQARRLQFEETLRQLDVGRETQRRSGSVGKERAIQQIGSKNVPPPREYQKIWESYTRSLSKQGEASDKPAPGKSKADGKSKKASAK